MPVRGGGRLCEVGAKSLRRPLGRCRLMGPALGSRGNLPLRYTAHVAPTCSFVVNQVVNASQNRGKTAAMFCCVITEFCG